jgi:hypothetical protein
MSAPRGNKFAKGHGQGRPSLYRPAFAAQAKTLCERGATNKDLAQYFNVDVGTIRQWRMNYQDFFTAVRMGKAVADELKRFPTDLNRWDSQEITDGGVFGH